MIGFSDTDVVDRCDHRMRLYDFLDFWIEESDHASSPFVVCVTSNNVTEYVF